MMTPLAPKHRSGEEFPSRRRKPLRRRPTMVGQNLAPHIQLPIPAPYANIDAAAEISVSEFDYSVENHFKEVDTIVKLCGQSGTVDSDQSEIERFSKSITFLREWRDFNYSSRVVRFAFQHDSEKKDIVGEVTLPQFSAASVPKHQNLQIENKITDTESSKDFVMHVGGAVWALDWCPRVDHNSESGIEPEFVAVAAHPPESSYHKMGAPLSGRGVIQIWCVLAVCEEVDVPSQCSKKRPRPPQRKGTAVANEPTKMQRPKGRPRKKSLIDPLEKADSDNQYVQPLAIGYPEGSSRSHPSDQTTVNTSKHFEDPGKTDANVLTLISPGGRGNQAQFHNNDLHTLTQDEHQEPSLLNPSSSASYPMNSSLRPHNKVNCIDSCDTYFVSKDVALPRMMLCLAHNGKLTWDVKWRPYNGCDPHSMKRMGILLSYLEMVHLKCKILLSYPLFCWLNFHRWDVPLPQTVKLVYPDCQECVDPRFIKLQLVFRCSILKCCDRQSIPLTLEWSVSDRILVGFHDGVVALWQFAVADPSTETRPLLSFSADTGPIRTLAWAPNQSDLEIANVIVTGGHRSYKFWDIRDPFRPLWEHPIQGITYSLSWLQDPLCIFGSIDDGTLCMVNLVKVASDLPISGKSHAATKWGTHNFDSSLFSIWSVHASQLTGMVAYCGEDGTVFCFQPTSRSVNDPSRNHIHHHLCGSLLEEESDLIVVSPLTHSPFIKQRPNKKRGSIAARYQETKTNEAAPKETCGGSDPVHELGCDNSSLTIKKQAPKSKQSSKNTLKDDQEVINKGKSE